MNHFFKTISVVFLFLLSTSCGGDTFKPQLVTDTQAVVGAAMKEVVNKMEAENWSPADITDKGSYGKAVHARTVAVVADNKSILGEVWLINVGRDQYNIVALGGDPPGSRLGLINIDVMRVARRPRGWQVGDTITVSQIFSAIEIKTSASGKWSVGQKEKYLEVVGGPANQGRISIALPHRRWSFKDKKFIPNIKYEEKVVSFKLTKAKVVAGVGIAGACLVTISMLEEIDELHEVYQRYATDLANNAFESREGQVASALVVMHKMVEVIGAADVSGNTQDIGKLVANYAVMDAWAKDHYSIIGNEE